MFKQKINIWGGLLILATACGTSDEKTGQSASNAGQNTVEAAPSEGKSVFKQYCVTCHGADGTLGLNGAKDLSVSVLPLAERVNIITNGKNLMTPFNTLLSAKEIQAVAEYTQTLKK